MPSKTRGFSVLLVVLLIAAALLLASVVLKTIGMGLPSTYNNNLLGPKAGVTAIQELTKTDSISDIDVDLNNTSFDDIDKDLNQAGLDISSN